MNYHDVVGTQHVNFKSVHGLKCVQKMASYTHGDIFFLYKNQSKPWTVQDQRAQ